MTQLLMLFWSFFQVGLFSFGGGMASLPLIQEQVVDTHAWLTLSEFSDLVTIAEMTPGPLAVNAATFVGIRIAGIPGALLATFGCILPACVLVTLLAWVYKRYKQMTLVQGALDGLRPAVVALIAAAGLSILELSVWGTAGFSPDPGSINAVSVVLTAAALILLRTVKKLSPIAVMVGCGAVGGAVYWFMGTVPA